MSKPENGAKNGNAIVVPPTVPFIGGARITGPVTILAFMMLGAGYWSYQEVKHRDALFAELQKALAAQTTIRAGEFKEVHEAIQTDRDLLKEVHQDIICKNDLSMWVQQQERGHVDWSAVPSYLWACIPNFKAK